MTRIEELHCSVVSKKESTFEILKSDDFPSLELVKKARKSNQEGLDYLIAYQEVLDEAEEYISKDLKKTEVLLSESSMRLSTLFEAKDTTSQQISKIKKSLNFTYLVLVAAFATTLALYFLMDTLNESGYFSLIFVACCIAINISLNFVELKKVKKSHAKYVQLYDEEASCEEYFLTVEKKIQKVLLSIKKQRKLVLPTLTSIRDLQNDLDSYIEDHQDV